MQLSNDYIGAIECPDACLFAVRMTDGGWTIADGPGTHLVDMAKTDLAGWHLPVRFQYAEQAMLAIDTGPGVWFDHSLKSAWGQHALACGADVAPEYMLAPDGEIPGVPLQ
ncbi:hypothetical protein [Ferrimonas marina]|uniref:Uncharacterized protein n=1 Tax=Ferrimonas marina TaxID=299255 RepID=A0A1M5U4L9_9GAMM|nr:hypothetical protein [Ferrimonas marina]SHH57811.1 hypothetical protein SAMN02745129_2403 [Ferrimonas marina]